MDRSSCAVCLVPLCPPGTSGQDGIMEQVKTLVSRGDGQVKVITTAEALAVIFEAHLKLNKVKVQMEDFRSSSIPTCENCAEVLGQLYSTFVQLLTLSNANSFLRQSIVKESMVWLHPLGSAVQIKQEVLSDTEDVSVFNSLQIDHEVDSDSESQFIPPRTQRSRISKNPRLKALIRKQKQKKIEKVKEKKKSKVKVKATMTKDLRTRRTPSLVSCDLCPLMFTTQRKLSWHLSKAHPGNPALTQCPICSKSFSSPRQMRRHKKRHAPERTHVCPTCSRPFMTSYDLKTHLLTHSAGKTLKCSSCPAEYKTPRALRHHENAKHGKGGVKSERTCPECGRYFPVPFIMKRHLRTVHHGAKDFQCSDADCGKKFTSKHMLEVHAEIHKSEEDRVVRIYGCPHVGCDKSYPNKGGLIRHVKVVHEKQLDFVCEECGKGFYERKELRSHMAVHGGRDRERTHPCPHCPKAFMTKGSLWGHVKTQHSSKDQEHLCSECGQAFKAYSSMCRHMACKHSVMVRENKCHFGPFKCELCGKEFKLKEYLTQHLRSKAHGGTGKHSSKAKVSSAGEGQSSSQGQEPYEYTVRPVFPPSLNMILEFNNLT